MGAFSVYIDSVNADRYVNKETLSEFSQRAESDSIWDFRTDDVSFEMDISYLESINLDLNRYIQLRGKTLQLKYYNQIVFYGVIEEVSVDYNSETLFIGAYSIGKICSHIPISTFTSDLYPNPFSSISQGVSIESAVQYLIVLMNTWLDENDYPFRLNNQIVYDVDDFGFYRSVHSIKQTLSSFPSGIAASGYETVTGNHLKGILKGAYSQKYYLVFAILNPISNGTRVFYVPFTADGLDYDNRFYKNFGAWSINDPDPKYDIPDELTDSNIKSILKKQVTNNNDFNFVGSVKFGDSLYYAVLSYNNKQILVKITIEQTDRYIFNYEDATAGEILSDFAKLSNSIIWFDTSGTIHFKSRVNINDAVSIHPEKLNSEVLIRQNAFEIPDAFLVPEDIQSDIIDYFHSFLNGMFLKYTITVNPDNLLDDMPQPLKKSLLDYNNMDAGIIIAINYREDEITIETEKVV